MAKFSLFKEFTNKEKLKEKLHTKLSLLTLRNIFISHTFHLKNK